MKVIVKARHMNLTPALKEHAEEKLGNAVMKVFDQPALKIEIELTDLGENRKPGNKECRATVYMPKGKTITIQEIDDDMYKAIDLAHDRVLVQVKRQLEKRTDNGRSRREAERERQQTARETLTAERPTWEAEVAAYEASK